MKELASGFRWVEVNDIRSDLPKDMRYTSILIKDLGEDFLYRYLILGKRAEKEFLETGKVNEDDFSAFKYMEEIPEQKMIPYTAETFPMWAVWIRKKGVKTVVYAIAGWDTGNEGTIKTLHNHIEINMKEDIHKWEIAGTDEIDGKMWHPFYLTE